MKNISPPLLIPNQINDDDLRQHFGALGVGTVAAYKLWCYRQGFSTDLHKAPEQRRAERALFERLQVSSDSLGNKDHDPRRAEAIARLFRGELRNEPLTDVLSRIRNIYNALEGDEEARLALHRLVLHVEKYGNLLRPSRAIKMFGHTVSNTYIGALEQLARHHRDWARPVEDWRPDTRKPRAQFLTLARHRLARYHVPSCMDVAWFQGNTPEARQQQGWFKHVGFGQNLRTAGVPMRITKRMAHIFIHDRSGPSLSSRPCAWHRSKLWEGVRDWHGASPVRFLETLSRMRISG